MKTQDAGGGVNPTPPNRSAAPTPGQPDPASALQSEIETLRRRIQQLEEEQARGRETIAALEAERDAYKRVAYHWALEQITEEDLERDAQMEDGEPLEAFIHELEEIENRARTPEE